MGKALISFRFGARKITLHIRVRANAELTVKSSKTPNGLGIIILPACGRREL
jgi:hypothetical protein